jgi:hypothetical protein
VSVIEVLANAGAGWAPLVPVYVGEGWLGKGARSPETPLCGPDIDWAPEIDCGPLPNAAGKPSLVSTIIASPPTRLSASRSVFIET